MQQETQGGVYEVLWPLSPKAVKNRGAAPRLEDLAGKTIAEIWDAKFRGDTIFPILREQLRSQYPDIKFVDYSEFGNFYGPNEREALASLPEKLRALGCDAAIVGIGA